MICCKKIVMVASALMIFIATSLAESHLQVRTAEVVKINSPGFVEVARKGGPTQKFVKAQLPIPLYPGDRVRGYGRVKFSSVAELEQDPDEEDYQLHFKVTVKPQALQ